MAQEKKPRISIPGDASIQPMPVGRGLMSDMDLASLADMVTGLGGGMAGMAKSVGKKIPAALKKPGAWQTAPKDVFDQFTDFNSKQVPQGGVMGSTPEQLVESLWQAFLKSLK